MTDNTTKGKVFLLPVPLAPDAQDKYVNKEIIRLISHIDHYFVENERTARRFIGSLKTGKKIDEISFTILDKNTTTDDLADHLSILQKGIDVGVMSESGCPGIADPGALIVAEAHKLQLKVIPLIGPSSIIMALMSSGFNGQQFTFHGYLPIDKGERKNRIKELEKEVLKAGYTQIFIETPYRNDKLLADLISHLNPATKLCVAANITADDEMIKTQPVATWKRSKMEIGKVPAIFLIGE